MVEGKNEVTMKKDDDNITAHEVIKMIIGYAIVIAVVMFVFGKVLMLSLIPSGSMENTIMTGDMVIATRYDVDEIDRYDILIFIPPDNTETYYIKRVIGLPGETVLVYNGDVYVDGVKIDSSFVPEEMGRSGDGEYIVPEGHYFMMGDNRNHSLDARFWKDKYVSQDAIIAKARFIIFPFSHAGSLEYDG